jgi:hypothetical protein
MLQEADKAIQGVNTEDITLLDFLRALAGFTATSRQALMDCVQRANSWAEREPMTSDVFEEVIKAYSNLRIGSENLDKATKLLRR